MGRCEVEGEVSITSYEVEREGFVTFSLWVWGQKPRTLSKLMFLQMPLEPEAHIFYVYANVWIRLKYAIQFNDYI